MTVSLIQRQPSHHLPAIYCGFSAPAAGGAPTACLMTRSQKAHSVLPASVWAIGVWARLLTGDPTARAHPAGTTRPTIIALSQSDRAVHPPFRVPRPRSCNRSTTAPLWCRKIVSDSKIRPRLHNQAKNGILEIAVGAILVLPVMPVQKRITMSRLRQVSSTIRKFSKCLPT